MWVAAGHLGHFRRSTDGIHWDIFDAGAGEYSTLFDATAYRDLCVIVGSANGPGLILTSVDGMAWSNTVIGTVGWLNGVAASPSRVVAVGDNGVILSSQ
jgi:hypothetical protein